MNEWAQSCYDKDPNAWHDGHGLQRLDAQTILSMLDRAYQQGREDMKRDVRSLLGCEPSGR